MAAVTNVMRVQQILLSAVDGALRPHGLTFARYEALVLLTFSRRGSLPMRVMGERLQLHPTSVTNIVDRLEADGWSPHPAPDRPARHPGGDHRARRGHRRGRHEVLTDIDFGLSRAQHRSRTAQLTELLAKVRRAAGDFT